MVCFGWVDKSSFFYSHFEQTCLGHLTKNDDTTNLLRYVDDFKFLTTSKKKAEEFLEIMHKGSPEYGCFVNPSKTVKNFEKDGRIIREIHRGIGDLYS